MQTGFVMESQGVISRKSTLFCKAAKCDFRRKHRRIVDAYMKRQIEEIDRVAEIDSRLFWRLENAKRKTSGPAVSSDINFDGRTASTQQKSPMNGRNTLKSYKHRLMIFTLIMSKKKTHFKAAAVYKRKTSIS